MVMYADDDVLRTEPTETPIERDGVAPPSANGERIRYAHEYRDGDQSEHAGFNIWLRNNLEFERRHVFDVVGSFLDEFSTKIDESNAKIKELELRIATLTGAVDILRGRGLPNGFRLRGVYDPTATYVLHDVVTANSGSYAALRDAPGACPGDDWQQLAGPGRRGQRGWRGSQGERGTDAPVWSGVSFDPKTLSVETRMSDGTLGPVLRLDRAFAGISVDPSDYSIKLVLNNGDELKFSLRDLFARFFDELGGARR
jgi:hypothetical protein